MTEDLLKAVLDGAQAAVEKDGSAHLPEGSTLTLYLSRGGVGLTVAKIESIRTAGGALRARTSKGELFVLAMEDVFAASVEGAGRAASRKAGFL